MFTRPGEVRQMQWAEINPDRSQWLIPAERMKLRQEHIVPLSRQMLALLDDIRPLTGYRQYVFPGRNDPRKPASNSVVRQALIRMGYDRSQHLPERTKMMQEWADYLDGLMGAWA